MAKTQVEQMLEDELGKITRELEQATSNLHERISALEQHVDDQSSHGASRSSGEQSDSAELSPEKRREIMDDMYYTEFLQLNNQGKYIRPEQDRPYMPLCRGCQHATPLDGELMQYQNDEIQPRFSFSGFVICQHLGQMPLRSGPKMYCPLMKPDGGDQPDVSKRERPKPF